MVNTALEMWTSQWGHELQEHMVGDSALDMARPRATQDNQREWVLMSWLFA